MSAQPNNLCFPVTLESVLSPLMAACDKVAVLCDTNTHAFCLPLLLKEVPQLKEACVITIAPGDEAKELATVEQIWQQMMEMGLTRRSLLINLGGGVITDLGGFAAATYQRGLRFVNLPTSLLAIVDASAGGKTGFNFCGVKNQIGVFADAECVAVFPAFLATLPETEFYSGLAEMVKHALLSDLQMVYQTLGCTVDDVKQADFLQLLRKNTAVKQHFVEQDPHDHGLRNALNLGHTFAHAFEAHAMGKGMTLPHGTAVMWGLLCALYLSIVRFAFPKEILTALFQFARENYAQIPFSCKDYEALLQYMMTDKKNGFGKICFTLLADVADVRIRQEVTKEEIFAALDFLREY